MSRIRTLDEIESQNERLPYHVRCSFHKVINMNTNKHTYACDLKFRQCRKTTGDTHTTLFTALQNGLIG